MELSTSKDRMLLPEKIEVQKHNGLIITRKDFGKIELCECNICTVIVEPNCLPLRLHCEEYIHQASETGDAKVIFTSRSSKQTNQTLNQYPC